MNEDGGSTTNADNRDGRTRLSSVRLEGYKSFRDATVDFGDVTVLLGANGAGKSNLVSFFRMLGFLSTNALQEFIGRSGRSDSILFGGRRKTPQLRATVAFVSGDVDTEERRNSYRMRLGDAAPDTLIFLDERVSYRRTGFPQPREVMMGSGHGESRLKERDEAGNETCRVIRRLLWRCRAYHFHDTSAKANIRNSCYIDDAQYLRDDAGNLAAYLYAMKEKRPDCYRRIVDTVRLAFPTFGDFRLAPSATGSRDILLNWHAEGRSDHLFGPHQLSDGTLRFMALATLFRQPPERLPNVIVLDEPELGLHPYAIGVLAGMIRAAATSVQVVLATQSTRLVDEFEPHQVVVLETEDGVGTRCQRLKPPDLEAWLEEYSLGELWEKNHFGGRP